MRPLSLSEIARMTGGRLHGEDRIVDAVATDTRAMPPFAGALFVALKGERFDGHDHLAAAAAGGAVAALVSRPVDAAAAEAGMPQVVVGDTGRALAALAAELQRTRRGKVIAITGSNGKTTVKTLLLSILQRAAAEHACQAYANPGNRNNEIGLPLSVIDAPDEAAFAIYEMGAGKPGDIAYLTAVVKPDVSLVNNIAPAHLERMGSLLGVADTKAAIYDALPADGVAVINADDAFAPYFAERAHGRRLLRFGIESSADVVARDIRAGDIRAGDIGAGDSRPGADSTRFVLAAPQGSAEVELPLPGRHNVRNALAAAALALGAGAAFGHVVAGLQAAQPVAGRLARHVLGNGALLIDDSYNANPGSLAAAIDTLAAGQDEAWLVLGDMRELGADAQVLHAEAGRQAKAAGIARLYALGELSGHAAAAFGEGARAFGSHAALADALRNDIANAGANALRILVKGSRGSAMDRIVAALLDQGGNAHAA